MKDEEEDKISKLPDAILCHILSFRPLTTKHAVQTSVLSRRWRYVWTSVPTIELNDYDPVNLKHWFSDFVDKVLRLNESHCLRKFSLIWNGTYDSSRVNEWIRNAITRRSVEILVFQSNQRFKLPLSIFTSKKLVILKLRGNRTLFNVPVSVCLPRLKIIHLGNVRLCNDDSMKNLLDGCPVLVELNFSHCYNDHITTLFVRSSSLKHLKLSIELGIVVDAPNLKLLDLRGKATKKIDVKDLPSLHQVILDLDCSPESVGADFYSIRLFELLINMSNTKYMTIYPRTVESLQQVRLDTLPTFHNLTDLHVADDKQNSGQVLPCLLECSPNLINLRYVASCKLKFREPKCLMLYLEKIRLDNFEGCPDEMKMVMYFLKNAPVLKMMSIDKKEDPKISEKVSVLPRTSTACRIEFQALWEYLYDTAINE